MMPLTTAGFWINNTFDMKNKHFKTSKSASHFLPCEAGNQSSVRQQILKPKTGNKSVWWVCCHDTKTKQVIHYLEVNVPERKHTLRLGGRGDYHMNKVVIFNDVTNSGGSEEAPLVFKNKDKSHPPQVIFIQHLYTTVKISDLQTLQVHWASWVRRVS